MTLELFFALAALIILAAFAHFVSHDRVNARSFKRAADMQSNMLNDMFGDDDDDEQDAVDGVDQAFASSPIGMPTSLTRD